jgi:hypothetical protein
MCSNAPVYLNILGSWITLHSVMKTVRIFLEEFQDAIDYVRAQPGQFPVGKSGQLEVRPSKLFTEEYQIQFISQYLKHSKDKWLERSCEIEKTTSRTIANRKLIIQMVDGAKKSLVINIDSFTW